ncbi:AarF/UbiB family protein [Microbacterium sp. NM3R9]|uniref:ABC1 kinase family protein n=1 Tax=Microbacterium thalli TaxID=3027921 RepID=UPI002366B702|nr:AarF/UbiB family protein [Microbacterium thalli]MDN8549089.1 AarF/UbiB family protein [Microbacterium thalli]
MRARYRRILRFAARALVQTWWFELVLPRFGLHRLADRRRAVRMRRLARRFHVLAVELGGLMIKVGQFMSSRLDVLPPEVTTELAGLQDEVPAVPFAQIRAAAEAELGMPVHQAFAAFDETPVAAASLGQAHRARLTPELAQDAGFADVIVKVQRPGISAIVDVDLAALRRVARWLRRIRIVAERADMPALVEEFAVTSLEEIDYRHEAANAERFRAEFAGNPRVAVPEIAWERSTARVLTLADVTAIKVADVDGLRRAGIDPHEVASVFASVMFDQFFGFGFFHADPHPGNVFVTVVPPEERGEADPPWVLTFIDFGMMGEIPPSTREALRTVLVAAASRDGRGLVAGIDQVGALLPSADVRELERAMTQLFARFGGMGFAELKQIDPREFRDFAGEFGELARALPFQLPENFLLVIRAASLTSGVCTSIDPAFNLWDAVEPYATRLLREERGDLMRDVARRAMTVADASMRLPQRLDGLITHLEDGNLDFDSGRLERRMSRLERLGRRAVSGILFAGLLVAGVLLRPDDETFGTVLMGASVLPLLHVLFAGLFTGGGGRRD